MAALFPNGSVFAIATSKATALAVTAITNASEAVATVTGTAPNVGDIVVISSGWAELNGAVARVKAVDTQDVTLEGIDTSDTVRYPAGEGVGSIAVASSWTSFSQVTDSQNSGGEQQFYQWVYLEDGVQRQRPTFKNARSLQITMDYDPSLSWHAALLAADRARTEYVIRLTLPNGDVIFYNMYVSFDGEPTTTINQNMQVVATFSFAYPRSIRYAA
jgi:hypothetical protein